MDLVIAIMAVPKRLPHVATMRQRLEGQILRAAERGLTIAPLFVHLDVEGHGPWWNFRACVKHAIDMQARYVLVLQDDVVFCADLPVAALEAASVHPYDPTALFALPRSVMHEARKKNVRWVRTRGLTGNVGMVLPIPLATQLLDWVDAHEDTEIAHKKGNEWGKHDDVRLGAFLREIRGYYYVAFPNLVDHIGHKGGIGSVMGHHGTPEKRSSAWFIGEDAEGARIDWKDRTYITG